MRLIIVRHGETLWNRENKLQGQTDIPISKKGLQQSKMLAKRLKNESIDVIYTSRLKRAIRTAQEIKKFHKNVRLIKEKGLNEMSWGIWEGLKLDYIKKRYGNLYEKRENNKFNFRIPKGESPKILKSRLKGILNSIIELNENKTVLIVGHGGVNRTILGILLKWSDKKILSVRLHNASINMLKIENNKARMSLFNSKHHLS